MFDVSNSIHISMDFKYDILIRSNVLIIVGKMSDILTYTFLSDRHFSSREFDNPYFQIIDKLIYSQLRTVRHLTFDRYNDFK